MGWEEKFEAALKVSADKAGISLDGLRFERCTTDATWGDRTGLVFFGASPVVNERAARFFETWASKNLRKLGAVGGYQSQESIRYEGAFHFSRYDNGANGWHRGPTISYEGFVKASGEESGRDANGAFRYAAQARPVETREGFATSFVYYPCAD